MKVFNQTKKTLIAGEVTLADTFFSRLIGLLRHKTLDGNEGLWITRCRSIHMFFMKFPIDAIFVDRRNRVVGFVENIQPNRLSRTFWKASACLELAAGTIRRTLTEVGDQLQTVQD